MTANFDYVASIETTAAKACRSILMHESSIGKRAGSWGCDMLNAIKVHGFDSDSLIGRTKTAAGWDVLVGKSGTKAKSVFNRWFSNLRTILEQWDDLGEEIQKDLLAGQRSFLSVVEMRQKAARDAKREAEREAKLAEKAEATAPAPASTLSDGAVLVSRDTLAAMATALECMAPADLIAMRDELARLVAVAVAVENAIVGAESDAVANAA